ncbi:hypothetical protein BD779DRAFT_1081320 [Infundibulicybe gibba]|nr:hypothetical protein BD779DRAFT_1081320 [Infundibulicybe gibba]
MSTLPVSQLESLKFKANQIIESIQGLQRTIENGYHDAMPAWPDILSKYNILLSQTHSFSTSLITPIQTGPTSRHVATNAYERIALHPGAGMSDAQLDSEVIPLLRNQQTIDVLKMESETVRRLSEHMSTRGSAGVLGIAPGPVPNGFGQRKQKPEYEDVLRECEEIRGDHDRRVERAVRAVMMLREKFEWKQRVEVEVEEPEELGWDPRVGVAPGPGPGPEPEPEDVGMESGARAGAATRRRSRVRSSNHCCQPLESTTVESGISIFGHVTTVVNYIITTFEFQSSFSLQQPPAGKRPELRQRSPQHI